MNTAGSISQNQPATCQQVFELSLPSTETELSKIELSEAELFDTELSDTELSETELLEAGHSVALRSETDAGIDLGADRQAIFGALVPHPIPKWKRLFDLVGSLALLVLLMPLLVCIAVFIRLVSKGPIFFKQTRLGEMGNDFVIYKFRTLHPSQDACEQHQKFVANLVASDEAAAKPDLSARYIPGAQWLRSTSLDELPQLINILRGEMSLIGPRPEVLSWDRYEPWQLKRFEVRPGVTGLWQVTGKNKLTFNQMVSRDIEYIAKRSLRLDMWIMFKTFCMMLRRDNT